MRTRAVVGRGVLPCLALLLLLVACGFQPLHGQAYRAAQSVDLSSLVIEVSGTSITPNGTGIGSSSLPRRYGEQLKADIEDQVNPSGTTAEKLFKLSIAYSELENHLFVKPDGTASRGDLVYHSTYTLTRLLDGKPIASGSIDRISSYNLSLTADYASYVSIEDARKRGMQELAQDYKLRLAALLPTLNNPTATALEKKPETPLPVLQPVPTYETIR